MPRISASGVGGSGLDINSIVQQLVSVERRPIEAARRKQVGITAKLSSFSSLRVSLAGLKSSLATLRSFSAFQTKSVSSSDSNVLTAIAASSATLGTSTVNEVKQRAKANKLQSDVFDSDTAVVGTGTLGIKVGDGEKRLISIDSSHHTLADIRDKINTANAGVNASVLKINETDFQLMLEARSSGKQNAIEVDVTDDDGNHSDTGGLSKLRYTPSFSPPDDVKNLIETQAAQDAIVTIDNVTFTRSTNSVTDAIPGVTLTLLKETGANANIAVNVSSNASSVRGKIESFVSSYNSVIEELGKAQAFDAKTKQSGPLLGNAAARTITNRLQALAKGRILGLTSPHDSVVNIGLTTEKNGTLKIDFAKLDAELQKDPLAVGRVFASVDGTVDPTVTIATSGVADLMHKAVSELLETKKGDIAAQEQGLRESILTIEEQVIRLEKSSESFEKKTRDRFSRLEAALEQIQGTGSVLDRQLSQLESLSGAIRRRNQRGSSSI